MFEDQIEKKTIFTFAGREFASKEEAEQFAANWHLSSLIYNTFDDSRTLLKGRTLTLHDALKEGLCENAEQFIRALYSWQVAHTRQTIPGLSLSDAIPPTEMLTQAQLNNPSVQLDNSDNIPF